MVIICHMMIINSACETTGDLAPCAYFLGAAQTLPQLPVVAAFVPLSSSLPSTRSPSYPLRTSCFTGIKSFTSLNNNGLVGLVVIFEDHLPATQTRILCVPFPFETAPSSCYAIIYALGVVCAIGLYCRPIVSAPRSLG
eukprot:m.14718 g.14718  ORF g.14718 m.14718 type:complete len:139 (+) comp10333_c0_seq1:478-894(+)